MRKLMILAALAVSLVTLFGSDGGQPASAQVPGWNFDDSGPFKFIDISTTGTELTDLKNCDDCSTGTDPPIGFTFNFKGTDYTEVEPTTNGVINMDPVDDETFINEAIPSKSTSVGDHSLFPFWDDLDGSDGSGSPNARVYAQTLGTAPNRVFIVQWDEFLHVVSDNPDVHITFQAALCEKGNIVFQYLDAVFGDPGDPDNTDNGGSASVGIQWSGQTGLQYSLNSAVITDNLAIVFYPDGGSPDNCVVALNASPPVGGELRPIDPADLSLETPESSGLSAGVRAGMVATIAAAAITLSGAAWYARRRWSR